MKRKRGGQKGNQNARTHGFYSRGLEPAEINAFWKLITQDGLAPEIAILRIKLGSLIPGDPANRRVLGEACKLMARWYSAKNNLDATARNHLRTVLNSIFDPDSICSSENLSRNDE